MRTVRVYCDAPLSAGSEVTLPPTAATHVARVLRLRAGAAVTLFDGRGGEYSAQLGVVGKRTVTAVVAGFDPIDRELPVDIVLLQGLARGEKMDWIVQKATELGVAALQPLFQSDASVRF